MKADESVGCGLAALLLAGVGYGVASQNPVWLAVPFYCLSAVCAVAVVTTLLSKTRMPPAIASQDGLLLMEGSAPRRIAWQRISRCEVRTRHDASGEVVSSTCVVLGRRQREIARVDLTGMTPEERARFLSDLEGAPAPTELLAAEAPAGRGTELASAGESDLPPQEPPQREGEHGRGGAHRDRVRQ